MSYFPCVPNREFRKYRTSVIELMCTYSEGNHVNLEAVNVKIERKWTSHTWLLKKDLVLLLPKRKQLLS